MIGQTISHYKILTKLGEGGMGVVYKAVDTKLKRTVALKFLPSSLMVGEAEKTRFVHEAQAGAALNHPNICTIYEIDEADRQFFIAMEFVEGQNLKEKIEAGPLQLDEALNIAMQIAEGLQAAHEKKITHRDVKPANIMLTTKGQVKIMDFGLAKLTGRTVITKEGMTVGTAAYMSPEQARGEEMDHRTDIWSFGVVLYEMICGRRPFRGEYEAALMYSLMNENPEPLTSLRTGVPMELEHIVNKCLEKDAAKRYQHIDDVPVDLRRIAGISHVKKTVSRPVTTRNVKPAILWPALILSAIVFAIAGYFFIGTKAESTERFPIAVVDFINETGEKELDSLTELLITALEQSRRLAVLPRASMFGMLSRLGKDSLTTFDESLVREICEQKNINAMAKASIRKFGKLYTIDLKIMDLRKNKYLLTVSRNADGQENIPALLAKLADETREGLQEVAEDIQANSANIIESTAANLEAYHHYFQGMQFYYRGKWREAQKHYEQAIAIDSTFGLAYLRLAMLFDWPGVQMELKEAKQINRKALNLIDKIPEKERYLLKAQAIMFQDESFPPHDYLAEAIPILQEMEKRYPDDRDMLFLIADYAFHTSQNRMASEYFDKFLEIEPEAFENRDALGHRFALYLRHNQFDEAESFMKAQSIDLHQHPSDGFFGEGLPLELYIYRGQYRRVLQIADRHIEWATQNNHPEGAVIYGMKVILLMYGWGDKDAARRQVEKGSRFLQSPNSYNIYYQILLGDYEKSEKMVAERETNFPSDFRAAFKILKQIQQGECEKAIATADSLLDPMKKYRFLDLYYALSFCYLEQGQAEKAIAALEVIQDVEDTYGWPSVWARALFYAKSFYSLGRAYEQQGDTRRAIENYEKFLDLWKSADEDLPELIDAKVRYAKLKGTPKK